MRIIIEVEPGTTVTGITSDGGAAAGPHDAVDTGPPQLGGESSDGGSMAAAQEVPGPPEDLIRQIEAARATSATQ